MKTKITIPEPCNEDWNKMTPTEKGAFCSSCSKEVKDFTNSSDQEILKTIEASENQICGHISNHQLNRTLDTVPLNRRRWLIPFAASFSALSISCDMNAQTGEMTTGEMISTSMVKNGNLKVNHIKPVDSIPICNITKGNMAIEKQPIIETEFLVEGLMIIQPIIKQPDTILKKEITHQKEDTIHLDSIPFKSQLNPDTIDQEPLIPNAKVFPNPTSDWTTIKVERAGLYNISIFNSNGRIILKKSFFGTSLKVNISNQPNGIYFITLINGEGLKSKSIKLVKN
jgi:hypothetical protein